MEDEENPVPRESNDPTEQIPDEVMMLVFQSLDAESIVRCAGVSHRWKRLALDTRMWKELIRRDVEPVSKRVSTVELEDLPLHLYYLKTMQKVHKSIARVSSKVRDVISTLHREQIYKERKKRSIRFGRGSLGSLLVLSLALSLSMGVAKADGNLNMSWMGALSPLLVWVLCYSLVALHVYFQIHYGQEEDVNKMNILEVLMQDLKTGWNRVTFVAFVLLHCIWLWLIVFKAGGKLESMSWSSVFWFSWSGWLVGGAFPYLLALFNPCCHTYPADVSFIDYAGTYLGVFILCLPVWLTEILVLSALEGKTTWVVAFVGWYIMEGLLIVALIFAIGTFQGIDEEIGHGEKLGMFGCSLVGLSPIVLSHLLPTLKMDGLLPEASWGAVFVPLFIVVWTLAILGIWMLIWRFSYCREEVFGVRSGGNAAVHVIQSTAVFQI